MVEPPAMQFVPYPDVLRKSSGILFSLDEVDWLLARDYTGKVGLSGKNRPGSPRVLRYKLRMVRI